MKHITHIFILITLIFSSANSFADNSLQQKAEKAYSEKRYKEAIADYEGILKEGNTSYELYYNLGNAYYKNNEIGKAIYNYELANKLKPNNEDVKTNLRIANEKTVDDIESKENFFLGAIKTRFVNSLTTTGWAWLSIISLSSCLLFAFVYFMAKQILFKRIGFFISCIMLITFFSSMSLGFAALHNKQQTKFAIIIARETKIHDEPTKISASKFSLHEGSKVRVLETTAEWTNIRLENGNEGWVSTSDIGLF